MPRFPVHTVEDAPVASQQSLEAVRDKLGTVLNIAGEMAHSPNDAGVEHGAFDGATREAVALAVGTQDGCGYCQSAHTLFAVQAGLSEQQTVAIRHAAIDFDSRLQALLVVTREITAHLGEVSDATYQRAQQAGFSEQQLTELYAHVAVNMFTNYFNHYPTPSSTYPPLLASPADGSTEPEAVRLAVVGR